MLIEEEAPVLDIAMPRVFQRPAAPLIPSTKPSVQRLLAQASLALQKSDRSGFGILYGEIVGAFHPIIQWALSCWEYLLSTEGCRFVPRSAEEKQYCRGDYRVFTENDFRRFVYKAFKECLLTYLSTLPPTGFTGHLRQTVWPTIVNGYRAFSDPPDPLQRSLTPYSYLRCVPYQFLNNYHQERVTAAVGRLEVSLRRVIELYHLHFYKEEAVVSIAGLSPYAFRRRRSLALRTIAGQDYLSVILLQQIERY